MIIAVLKQIAAVGGQRVCICHDTVYIDGAAVTHTLDVDSKRRLLPTWQQCRLLIEGELFLLNVSNPASFDSRYFGPLDASFVRGRAVHCGQAKDSEGVESAAARLPLTAPRLVQTVARNFVESTVETEGNGGGLELFRADRGS